MRTRIILFGRYFLYWYIIFIIERLLFVFYHWEQTSQYASVDIVQAVLIGSRMDWSTTGYIMLLPAILLVFSTLIPRLPLRAIFSLYTSAWLLVSVVVTCIDLELYEYWGYRLDATPLLMLSGDNTPWEAIPEGTLYTIGPIFITLLLLGYSLYHLLVTPLIKKITDRYWWGSVVMLLFTVALIIPIRGSFDVAPFNIGFVYFHQQPYPNHVAINATWNTIYSLATYNSIQYPENYLEKDLAKQLFQDLKRDEGETRKVLHTDRPNIILVIWESFNAQITEAVVGKEKGVTPNFDALVKEGILFTKMFAVGDRTNRGVPGILSGYPGQPRTAVIKHNSKLNQIDYLSRDLKDLGYYTSFIFGNNINFSNFNSYLRIAGYDQIIHKEHFPSHLWTTKWGVHDEYVFERIKKELLRMSAKKQPFFLTTLTISSHEPFDVPLKDTPFQGEDKTSKFLNAYYYADQQIGDFVSYLKQQPYWENTLLVITGDHGAKYRNDIQYYSEERYQVPMLWLGGALSKKNIEIDTYTSHIDFVPTLLAQLDSRKSYKFGKNIFSSDMKSYAFYTFNDGYAFLSDSIKLIYDNVGKQYILDNPELSQEQKQLPQAILQTIYSDFNQRGKQTRLSSSFTENIP
ncbi:LTA synthase family protein [Algivirga pacifica]|uniref:Alkaline phosphatase family protein n=1 Tax=Algivirga pacifica TaxID=1162670 RepID=A0ABP9DAP9_9BACT